MKLNLRSKLNLRKKADIADLKHAYKVVNEAVQRLNMVDLSTEDAQNFINQQFARVRDMIIPENIQNQTNLDSIIFNDTQEQFFIAFNRTDGI